VVNIGTGRRPSVNDIVAAANRLAGKHVEPVHAPPRAGDVLDSLADITAARGLLGYEPSTSFQDGLRAYVQSLTAGRCHGVRRW
jgi:nucleoside-diphosphate-sugar epimerase